MNMLKAMFALALAALTNLAHANLLTVVIPFPAGGVTDRIWRTIEPELNQELKNHNLQVTTEYILGNGGAIGASKVAAPGANKLLFVSSSLVISMVNNSAVSYGPDDFNVLGNFGSIPMLLAVPENGPNSLQEFVAQCRGGNLTYATAGVGSTNHLSTVAFLKQHRCTATAVPYKSQTLAVPDLVAGRINFIVDFAASTTAETVKQGKLKNIHNITDLSVKNWHVLAANKNHNPEQLAIVRQAVQRVLSNSSVQQQLQQLGLSGAGQPMVKDFLEQQRKVFDRVYQDISK